MDNIEPSSHHDTTAAVSLLSAMGSVLQFIYAHATKSDIAFFLGCSASCVAMLAGIYSIKVSRKKLKE